MKDYTYLGI